MGIPTSITYANGHKSPVVGMLTSSLKLCGSTFLERFLLADLSENLDVILGHAWLRDHHACWDFAKGLLTLSQNGKSCSVTKPTEPIKSPIVASCAVLSFAQFMKAF